MSLIVRPTGARLLIALLTVTAATAAANEIRYFPPTSTIKPGLMPSIARAERHEKAGQLQNAISDYKEAIRLDPHSVLCWAGLARLFKETRQYDKALAAYSSVLEFEPSNLPARFLRGLLYQRLGANDKAMADATEVIRAYPKRAEGYTLRAGLHNVKDDYQKTIADANHAIQTDPRNIAACIDAYFALGFAHLRVKAYYQAVLDLTAGLKLDPKDRTALNTEPLVRGKITFDEVTPSFTGATMHVRLERITAADIASETVADYVERDVAFDPKTSSALSFAIAGSPPDPRATYAVRPISTLTETER